MRVVVDTNVVVSTFLSPTGAPAGVLAHWQNQSFEWVVSDLLLREYHRALLYDRVAARHGMSTEEVAEVVMELRRFALVVEPQKNLAIIREDPDDDRVLECAVAGDPDYIISGDKHLLRLREYRGIPILSPSAFLAAIGQEETRQV